ncbi:dihydrouridine synthase 3 isoform X1 [Rhodnius prolixus]
MAESVGETSTEKHSETLANHEVEIEIIKNEFVLKDHERILSFNSLAEQDKRKFEGENEGYKARKLKNGKQKLKGQNKARNNVYRLAEEGKFCSRVADTTCLQTCDETKCKFQHDRIKYINSKPEDLGPLCYVYSLRGHCPRGVTCRYGSSHLSSTGENLIDIDRKAAMDKDPMSKSVNYLSKELQVSLRKKQYDFSKSNAAIKFVDSLKEDKINERAKKKSSMIGRELFEKDLLFLSPLTTVGNLPFRRICKEYGADVTCSEMAVSTALLQGHNQEWALIRRHPSENIFGVQIEGNNPYVMTKCAQLLQENAEIDFVDINVGCPIDLIFDQGGGCALLRRPKVLKSIIHSMVEVLDVPLTLKTRMGVSSKKLVARELMPMFEQSGLSMVTVHGRTKEQRYTKLADWTYIERCAQEINPCPLYGNGDILSYYDYLEAKKISPHIKGVMIGRGALIKPWIFREIKDCTLTDPSASERMEMLKKYVNYGLEHWGSDTRGVETTRRFLLEWLSFLYRYIPTGLLVNPPQKTNVRPPYYKGRCEMETLMASPNCSDWIKISEMLLGKVPEGFTFLPKHKANAWK